MKRHHIALMLTLAGAFAAGLVGCHANADDPAGQAEELADPVRRQNAIQNISRLYTSALAKARTQHEGEDARAVETVTDEQGRDIPGPKAVADATIAELVRTYQERSPSPTDGLRILEIINEMQDPRGLPALESALDWRTEVSEEHAIRAAQAIARIDVPEGERAALIRATADALERITGSRPDDYRMRLEFIRLLGHFRDPAGVPALLQIVTNIADDARAFSFNRMAAEQVGQIGDASGIDTMLRALFLFVPSRPDMRMNDVAAQALVQIGRPAHEPLVDLLAGHNQSANRIARNYITAIGRVDENAAEQMDPRTVVVGEACYALGQLGFSDALDPILAQIQPLRDISVRDAEDADQQVINRAHACVVALVSVNRSEAQASRVREALIEVYERLEPQLGMQLLVGMQHTYDPGLLDLFFEEASPGDRPSDVRALAYRGYALLATNAEAARLVRLRDGEGAGPLRENFDQNNAALEVASECNDNLECYIGKLEDEDAMVVRKAAYMVARLGRGNAEALSALIPHLDHDDQFVRGDVLYAVDWVATEGSEEAVAAIDALREAEEGRSSWNQIKSVAMAIRARLEARHAGEG